MTSSPWRLSHRADPSALGLADRHYNRQKIGSPQFVPPGRNLVLLTENTDALWVTSWPFAEYVRHAWPGAWVNSLFRNEANHLSSGLIQRAVGHTVWRWPEPPDLPHPIVTFIDRHKTRPKRDPGYCYLMAGWERIGETKGGLVALGLPADEMPEPLEPIGAQMGMLG